MPVPLAVPHTYLPGGDAAVKKKRNPPLWGNVIETMQFGNVTIHVCDDCIAQTPEAIEKVLDEFHAAGWAIVEELVAKGEAI